MCSGSGQKVQEPDEAGGNVALEGGGRCTAQGWCFPDVRRSRIRFYWDKLW